MQRWTIADVRDPLCRRSIRRSFTTKHDADELSAVATVSVLSFPSKEATTQSRQAWRCLLLHLTTNIPIATIAASSLSSTALHLQPTTSTDISYHHQHHQRWLQEFRTTTMTWTRTWIQKKATSGTNLILLSTVLFTKHYPSMEAPTEAPSKNNPPVQSPSNSIHLPPFFTQSPSTKPCTRLISFHHIHLPTNPSPQTIRLRPSHLSANSSLKLISFLRPELPASMYPPQSAVALAVIQHTEVRMHSHMTAAVSRRT